MRTVLYVMCKHTINGPIPAADGASPAFQAELDVPAHEAGDDAIAATASTAGLKAGTTPAWSG